MIISPTFLHEEYGHRGMTESGHWRRPLWILAPATPLHTTISVVIAQSL